MNRRRLTVLAGLIIVLGGIGYGIHAWLYSLHHVTTDDAYVESTISPLSAKVAGHVAELRVDDNQSVKAGDLLPQLVAAGAQREGPDAAPGAGRVCLPARFRRGGCGRGDVGGRPRCHPATPDGGRA